MWLDKPVEKVGLNTYLLTGLFGVILCLILFEPIETEMMSLGYSIVDFQFAWFMSSMDSLLSAWAPIMDSVITFMVIDMFYPIFYFMFLSGLAYKLEQNKELAVQLFLTAAICDYVENLFSFAVLLSPDDYLSFIPPVISIAALIKFIALISGLVLLLFVFVTTKIDSSKRT